MMNSLRYTPPQYHTVPMLDILHTILPERVTISYIYNSA